MPYGFNVRSAVSVTIAAAATAATRRDTNCSSRPLEIGLSWWIARGAGHCASLRPF